MLIFIDESGDPGFKLGRGSSSHFVVAMVIFDKNEDAEFTAKVVKEALTDLKIRPEFKFNQSRNFVRDEFFNKIIKCKFRVRALVVDKEKIYSKNLREDDEKFYNYFVRLLIDFQELKLNDVSIKIDGSGDREFKKELNRYLRSQVKSNLKLKIELAQTAGFTLGFNKIGNIRVRNIKRRHLRTATAARARYGKTHFVVNIHEA